MKLSSYLITVFSGLTVFTACNTEDIKVGRTRFSGQDGLSTLGPQQNVADVTTTPIPQLSAVSAESFVSGENIPVPAPSAKLSDLETIVYAEKFIIKRMAKGNAQLQNLCSRPGDDQVHNVFCKDSPPAIASLRDLQSALGIAYPASLVSGSRGSNAKGGRPGFSVAFHSNSLVRRFVSALNPRMIIHSAAGGELDDTRPNPNYVAMGFTRGEQFVEIAAQDPKTKQPSFFLVRFEQSCNANPAGCSFGDLLTSDIEKNWTSYTIYDHEDLKNTVFDCLVCHQQKGLEKPRHLVMFGFNAATSNSPGWGHFFLETRAVGKPLLDDYYATHGNSEEYAGIPGPAIHASRPGNLDRLLMNHGSAEFGITLQPIGSPANVNVSNSIYEKLKKGEGLPPPFPGLRHTDPTKQSAMTKAYQDMASGRLPKSDLPDIRDIFSDEALLAMGVVMKPDLEGKELLNVACSLCHNSRLDQNLTRARFNVDLSRMSREEKNLAIKRISMPQHDPRHMPPLRFTRLDEEAKAKLIEFIRNN